MRITCFTRSNKGALLAVEGFDAAPQHSVGIGGEWWCSLSPRRCSPQLELRSPSDSWLGCMVARRFCCQSLRQEDGTIRFREGWGRSPSSRWGGRVQAHESVQSHILTHPRLSSQAVAVEWQLFLEFWCSCDQLWTWSSVSWERQFGRESPLACKWDSCCSSK
jgi:hypothetical protein